MVPDDSDNDINNNVNVQNEDGDVLIIGTSVNIKEGMFSQLGGLDNESDFMNKMEVDSVSQRSITQEVLLFTFTFVLSN